MDIFIQIPFHEPNHIRIPDSAFRISSLEFKSTEISGFFFIRLEISWNYGIAD